jgi:hypothetical protein
MPSKSVLKTPYNIEAEYHSGIFVYKGKKQLMVEIDYEQGLKYFGEIIP